ncbi:hypothetical protein C7M84_025077 [Penaeus vannamei]|uniref:Uncharacterized protein n=1 Tax=Penaeus vannamei TaxID=6689 RepID=A0A3R7MNH8_PENVA|nr:hypothetical protein C7M84_025077 [Penaeus vannamei]
MDREKGDGGWKDVEKGETGKEEWLRGKKGEMDSRGYREGGGMWSSGEGRTTSSAPAPPPHSCLVPNPPKTTSSAPAPPPPFESRPLQDDLQCSPPPHSSLVPLTHPKTTSSAPAPVQALEHCPWLPSCFTPAGNVTHRHIQRLLSSSLGTGPPPKGPPGPRRIPKGPQKYQRKTPKKGPQKDPKKRPRRTLERPQKDPERPPRRTPEGPQKGPRRTQAQKTLKKGKTLKNDPPQREKTPKKDPQVLERPQKDPKRTPERPQEGPQRWTQKDPQKDHRNPQRTPPGPQKYPKDLQEDPSRTPKAPIPHSPREPGTRATCTVVARGRTVHRERAISSYYGNSERGCKQSEGVLAGGRLLSGREGPCPLGDRGEGEGRRRREN